MGIPMFRTMIAAAIAVGMMTAPTVIGSAAAQTPAPAASTKASTSKKPASAGQQAMHERQMKCGAEWKEAKAAGKVEKGTTWPKYWSACNKRLKAGG
jgi:hypothetical protein